MDLVPESTMRKRLLVFCFLVPFGAAIPCGIVLAVPAMRQRISALGVVLGAIVLLVVAGVLWRWMSCVRRAEAWQSCRCSNCGYDLRGTLSPDCPECGSTNEAIKRIGTKEGRRIFRLDRD